MLKKLLYKMIPEEKGCIYLGLPIGDQNFNQHFIDNKFKKVEKSTYSLKGVGPGTKTTGPRVIGYTYQTYCQSLLRYPLDNILINKQQITELNTRQNLIIKNLIGLQKYTKTKSLMKALEIEHIELIYYKHKLSFFKQIKNNCLTNNVFIFLREFYNSFKSNRMSFESQFRSLEKILKSSINGENLSENYLKLSNVFAYNNNGLTDSVKFLLFEWHKKILNNEDFFETLKTLNCILKISFD